MMNLVALVKIFIKIDKGWKAPAKQTYAQSKDENY